MEEAISRLVTELETNVNLNNPDPQTGISESVLLDLQSLFDDTLDSESADLLWQDLSSRNLSSSSLVRLITHTMDSGPSHLSLLASKLYLSILLSPNSPVFTLFTPMSFLSLLRSIRRYLKRRNPTASATDDHASGSGPANRKKKGWRWEG